MKSRFPILPQAFSSIVSTFLLSRLILAFESYVGYLILATFYNKTDNMAIISSTRLIQIVSTFHLTLAYILFSQPRLFEEQGLVVIIGGAMGLPHSNKFGDPKNRTLTTFLGLMFAWFGVTDMVSTGVEQLAYRAVWANQAPIRVFMFFCLVGYPFIFQSSGSSLLNVTTAMESLKSNVIFTWAMFESIAWFWILTTLREERSNAIAELERKGRAD